MLVTAYWGQELADAGVAIGVSCGRDLDSIVYSGLLFGVTATDSDDFRSHCVGTRGSHVDGELYPLRRAASTNPITALRSD